MLIFLSDPQHLLQACGSALLYAVFVVVFASPLPWNEERRETDIKVHPNIFNQDEVGVKHNWNQLGKHVADWKPQSQDGLPLVVPNSRLLSDAG